MYRTYRPKEVVFNYAGATLEGWEDITVSRNMEQARQVQGIWGKPTKISNYANTSATVRVTVSYGSETNKILAMLVELDRQMRGGVKFNLFLRDMAGDGIVFESSEAYLEGMAEESWTGSAGSKTWTFLCDTSKWDLTSESTSTDSLVEQFLSLLDRSED